MVWGSTRHSHLRGGYLNAEITEPFQGSNLKSIFSLLFSYYGEPTTVFYVCLAAWFIFYMPGIYENDLQITLCDVVDRAPIGPVLSMATIEQLFASNHTRISISPSVKVPNSRFSYSSPDSPIVIKQAEIFPKVS
jgi:hypothetical protein